ncbi:hypothetical protein J2X11_002007 [Aeromicrobium panaciterrae]|uniref:DUF4126 domain-containing protein n=1 Tax=Aeromicrobium panaciterrae TaxID=363861 RepID=A0ABU1UPQ5_9ACTN|nr:DUF4126 domain-containing protein [Aeromicrobium panaciterrae]MDR7087168.1 hypothetical protein [Aeromicrobium panaciterrae]
MDLAALVFSSGWASGVNAYATVGVLGLLARFTETSIVPDAFARTDVLVVAGVMFLVEFVVDKIPWLDSVWDGISTVVRPTVGAWVAYQLAGDSSGVDQALLTTLGGSTALASHGVKSGVRLAVNTSPEPFSNGIVSTTEDIGVITVVSLAVAHPWWALGITASLLIAGAVTVFLLWKTISRARRRRREANA